MYTALYRAKRPEVFDTLLGQEHVVKILRHQIQTGSISHAYLFCGTRGTGKTTVARLLAKAVNCTGTGEKPCGECPNCQDIKNGNFIDVIEIDAASNNGVESVRELRESVTYPPVAGRKKVYIIDEAHMLTTQACNALLKTLEEPPETAMFILATTDPQKLPTTILSRCMRLDFKRVPETALATRMAEICQEQGVEASEGALRLLASNADGSVRDGLSILDQVLAGGDRHLDREMVVSLLGTASEGFYLELTEKILLGDSSGGLLLLDELLREGKDVKQVLADWLAHYRSLLIAKYIRNPEDMLNLSAENIQRIQSQANSIDVDQINDGILTISRTIQDARYSTQPRVLMELAIVSLASGVTGEPAYGKRMREPKVQTRKAAPAAPVAPSTPAAPASPSPSAASAQPAAPDAPAAQPVTVPPWETPAQTAAPDAPAAPAAPEAPVSPSALAQAAAPEAPAGSSAPAQTAAPVAPEEEPALLAGIAPEAAPGEITNPEELEDIWDQVFDRAMDLKESLYMLKADSTLAAMGTSEFKVLLSSDFKKELMERDNQLFCDLMEQVTGRRLRMTCKAVGSADADQDQVSDQVAQDLKNQFGINIEITD